METFANKDIEIAAVYLSNNRDRVRFESYPRRLTYKGREYTLVET